MSKAINNNCRPTLDQCGLCKQWFDRKMLFHSCCPTNPPTVCYCDGLFYPVTADGKLILPAKLFSKDTSRILNEDMYQEHQHESKKSYVTKSQEQELIESHLNYSQEEDHNENDVTYSQQEDHNEKAVTYSQEQELIESHLNYSQEEDHNENDVTYSQQEDHNEKAVTYSQEQELIESHINYQQEEDFNESFINYSEEQEQINECDIDHSQDINNNYGEPRTENDTEAIEKIQAEGDEQTYEQEDEEAEPEEDCRVAANHSKQLNQKTKKNMDSELIPDLIAAVRRQPVIWDYKLRIDERSRQKVHKAWEIVVKDLEGKVTLNLAKERWKTLRDRYCRITNENRKQRFRSGAAASPSGRAPWVYYKMLMFLDTSLDTNRTISNISETVAESESSESASPSSFITRSRKRSLGQVVSSALDKIVDVMKQPQSTCQKDNLSEIDGFGIMVVEKIKKIRDNSLRNNVMFEILKVLHSAEQLITHDI